MSKAFVSRVARLEARSCLVEGNIAVVRAPLPQGDLDAWAHALICNLGWADRHTAIWVTDGPLEVQVSIKAVDEVRGDDEMAWLRAGCSYPHVVIVIGEGRHWAVRYESEAEEHRLIADLRKELANV